MRYTRLLAILGVIFCGVASRFFPHPPNFTAVNAIALFSASTLGFGASLSTVFSMMLISDVVIGFHSSMFYVYLSLSLIVLLGRWIYSRYSLGRTLAFLPVCSLLFFFVTNFGAWLGNPMYPQTYSGLGICYIAAIPFLASQVLGDLFYGALFFGCFELLRYSLKSHFQSNVNEFSL